MHLATFLAFFGMEPSLHLLRLRRWSEDYKTYSQGKLSLGCQGFFEADEHEGNGNALPGASPMAAASNIQLTLEYYVV